MLGLSTTFFPEQDNGLLVGQIIADQSISFQAMRKKLQQLQQIVQKDPAVASVIGFTGIRALNTANVYVALKPLAKRSFRPIKWSQRLRPKLNRVSGARLFLQAVQDLRIGGRQSAAEYQYTLTATTRRSLHLDPKLIAELGKHHDQLVDVNSDMQQNGLQTYVNIERTTAQRYDFTPIRSIPCFTTPTASAPLPTIFNPYNQYYVVMEVAPQYWQFPQMLDRTFLSTASAVSGSMPGTAISAGRCPAARAVSWLICWRNAMRAFRCLLRRVWLPGPQPHDDVRTVSRAAAIPSLPLHDRR